MPTDTRTSDTACLARGEPAYIFPCDESLCLHVSLMQSFQFQFVHPGYSGGSAESQYKVQVKEGEVI